MIAARARVSSASRARLAVLMLALALTLAASAQAPRAFTVAVHDTLSFQVIGATSAYAIDANIADASASNGTITIYGRSAGRTQLVVISMTGQSTFALVVEPQRNAAQAAADANRGSAGHVESRYASAGRQLQNTVHLERVTAKQRTELHLEHIQYGAAEGTRASSSIPSASYRIFTKDRELTFLDRQVDHSPLTVSSMTIRGAHYLDEHWRFHAGYTAYTLFQSFLLPADRRTVIGAAYVESLGPHARITPGIFAYRDGQTASMLYDYDLGERLSARAELGLSHTRSFSAGAAAQLAYADDRDRVHVDLRYRPREFATPMPSDPRGLFADTAWTRTFRDGSSLDAAFSSSDFDLPNLRQRTRTANVNARVRLTDTLALLGGASYGSFDSASSVTIPLGLAYDRPRFGVTALARWAEASTTNEGGLGYRIAARASLGRVFASTYVDYQRQAPTLALIFREEPDLALALAQLGITATTPADIARALRENAVLFELGYIEGVTVDLAPARTQAGFELAWLGAGPARPQVRARLLFNRLESVGNATDTVIATISASRRLTEAADVYASYSWWKTARRGEEPMVEPLVEAGVRYRFDELPSFGAHGSIRGAVYVDENLDGVPDGTGVAEAQIDVDGTPRARTSADGSFTVGGLTSGTHRVVARVPRDANAYFTTPSRVEASSGDTLHFGVAFTPARVFGRVTSDAGEGLVAKVALAQGSARFEAQTASDGSFTIAAPPGEWELSVDPLSLPAGYSSVEARSVRLARETPRTETFTIRANRSISGRAPAGVASIVVEPLGKTVPVDAEGHFAIRSLPAGEVTLRARFGSHELTRRVTLPREPASLTEIALGDARENVAVAANARVIFAVAHANASPAASVAANTPPASAPRDGRFVVQLGTFRVHANAVDAVVQARRNGVEANVITGAQYTVVRTAPFATRSDANAVSAQLTHAGLEAIVLPLR
ncbi:MAG: SPOR domain-containing protein [Acidobacteria bacterium]|nr:SPOR domain-containing protein [Acidobacteriota bacterium]MBV9477013.1 SPOR domain-containing protein [Acidobacteriota bacterium]